MLSRERFARIYAHQEADRVPIIDDPWAGTLRRWRREGMPGDMAWADFFGIDKLGMDPLALKERYGRSLTLHGGINAVLWNDPDAIISEIDRLVPKLKEGGGYIFSSDHSIPNTVSLSTMEKIVARVKEKGSY